MSGKSKKIDKAQIPATASNLANTGPASKLANTPTKCPVTVTETRSSASVTKLLPADLENLRSVLLTDLTKTVSSLLAEALAPVNASLGAIQSTMDLHARRITDVEAGLSDYSDRIVVLESDYATLKTEYNALVDKVDDLENRSRRSNLRVVGIPEKMEGLYPAKFMTELFTEILGPEFFPTPLKLDRAHRLGRANAAGGDNNRARAFIVLFHNYQDKERVFGKRRDNLCFRGHKIFFYPDFSASLARRRAAFNDVKARLYRKNIRFGLLHPARLRVDYEGQTLYFDSPAAAQAFYDSHWQD